MDPWDGPNAQTKSVRDAPFWGSPEDPGRDTALWHSLRLTLFVAWVASVWSVRLRVCGLNGMDDGNNGLIFA